jgi:hypothetical protein
MEHLEHIAWSKADADLLRMIYDIDKWSPRMLNAVANELSKRGLLPDDIEAYRKKKIAEEEALLNNGKSANKMGLTIGWLTSFSIIGALIGYYYSQYTINSRYTGKAYYCYNNSSRKTATVMMVMSSILSVVSIVYIFKHQ